MLKILKDTPYLMLHFGFPLTYSIFMLDEIEQVNENQHLKLHLWIILFNSDNTARLHKFN